MIDKGGWQVVSTYTDAQREADSAHAGLGLADITSYTKVRLHVRWPEHEEKPAARLVDSFGPPGERWLACRLTDENMLLLASRPNAGERPRMPGILSQTDATFDYAGFMIVGPRLEELLRRLTLLDLRPASFPLNSCAETALARVEALLVRSGELKVPCMRIYVAWDLGEYVWERILEAGRDLSISPMGLDALAFV
jgi:heterotetrameric sarcosine oxidase gamma subunit